MPYYKNGQAVNHHGQPYSDECLENGSGACDGYLYDNQGYSGSPCACTCHGQHAPNFATLEEAKEWHATPLLKEDKVVMIHITDFFGIEEDFGLLDEYEPIPFNWAQVDADPADFK